LPQLRVVEHSMYDGNFERPLCSDCAGTGSGDADEYRAEK
jgi:hypothetical protein